MKMRPSLEEPQACQDPSWEGTPSGVSVPAGSTQGILPAVTQTHKFHCSWDPWGRAAICSEFCELVMMKRIYPAARMTASLQAMLKTRTNAGGRRSA